MTEVAQNYQTMHPTATDGLEELFLPGLPQEVPGGLPEGVPVNEAAEKLGLTERAVLKRLRRGTLKGFKISSKRGEKWLVSSSEVAAGVPEASPVLPIPVLGLPHSDEGLPEGAPEFDRGLPSNSYNEIERLLDLVTDLQSKLDKAQEQLQSASFRNGYLESKLEDKEHQIKLLTDSQHKASWWARFSSCFFQGR